jgi:hypothetical protein
MSAGISALIAVATLVFCGCGKTPDAKAGLAGTPEQAASQIEQAFAAADTRTKDLATAVSEALRKNDYENAVVSLQTIRANNGITPEQRTAIYGSAVTLEARLISAMQSGDKNAERAYELLKTLKRN